MRGKKRTDYRVIVADMKTFDAALKYREGKTCVLNFASFKNPGGGFLKGTIAQEEYLCQNSTLYNVLSQFTSYYEKNRLNTNDALYWNRAIYSPGIVVLPSEVKLTYCPVLLRTSKPAE